MKNDEFISTGTTINRQERGVKIWGGAVQLEGVLQIPAGAEALVVIAYDRIHSSLPILDALNALADACRGAGLAFLLVNLLTPDDEALDKMTGYFRENVDLLHNRLLGITKWLYVETPSRAIGYFGVGVSAAAALAAAAMRPDAVHAIVAADPRIDLVSSYLPRVVTPTLLINAEKDTFTLDMSSHALAKFTSDMSLDNVREARERGIPHTLETIPGVAKVFANERSLQQVQELATHWFTHYLLPL